MGACVCVCTHAGGNVFALNWFVMFLHSFDLLSFVQSTFFAILGQKREREREREKGDSGKEEGEGREWVKIERGEKGAV